MSNTTTQSPVESRYQQQGAGQLEQHEGADRGLQGKLEACSAVRARGGYSEPTNILNVHRRPLSVKSQTQVFALARARAQRAGEGRAVLRKRRTSARNPNLRIREINRGGQMTLKIEQRIPPEQRAGAMQSCLILERTSAWNPYSRTASS